MIRIKSFLDALAGNRGGALLLLAIAAFLEAWGDSFFQVAFYRSSGWPRVAALLTAVLALGCYGAMVNTPRWDFGRMLGVYVVLFFLMAQLLNFVRFGQRPTLAIYAGGALIVAGGLVLMLGIE